jgi:hypothetical protein
MLAYWIYRLNERDKIAGPPQKVTCDDDDGAIQQAKQMARRPRRRAVAGFAPRDPAKADR